MGATIKPEFKHCDFCGKSKRVKSFCGDKCDNCYRQYKSILEKHFPDLVCSECGISKPVAQFKARRQGRCIQCQVIHAKALKSENARNAKGKGAEQGFDRAIQSMLSRKW